MIRKKMVDKDQGGDIFLGRLLSYLRTSFPFDIEMIKPIRNHVFIVESQVLTFVLKAFPSYHHLKLQETFTATLKREGFKNTYSFLELASDPPLFFEGTYYGCLQYINPSLHHFSYQEQKNRLEGLEILSQYHMTTNKFAGRYMTILGKFRQLEKWKDRYERFLNNSSTIKVFLNKEIINKMLHWANWSLKGMEKELQTLEKEPMVVLHGDVAHHNFLRAENGDLLLIDFDLISIGHARFDYLQYANRILPFLHWSLDDLMKMKNIKSYCNEKGFLYSLAFPTDIFREWNRVAKESKSVISDKVPQVMDLTLRQFAKREKFVNDLKLILYEQ